MKILILQDRLRSGGTERQSIHLARMLIAAGHRATLLTFRPGGTLAETARDLTHIALQKIDLHLDWFAPGLYPTIAEQRPDLILCMGRMANCYGGLAQKQFPRIPVVSTMRTGKQLPWLFRRSLLRTRRALANSHEAARQLRDDYGVPAEKITVIHNALVFRTPPALSESGPSPLTPCPSPAAPQVRLLCVAMFRPEKNHRALIDLAARLAAEHPDLPPWQLHLAGDGPALAACQAHARSLGLEKQIHFPGFQSDPTPLYRSAHIAVLASRSESLSNFLIEAHAHGLPSVAYNVGGVAECGGRVAPPNDSDAFLAQLLPLLRDPALRAAEGQRAATHVREHFSTEKQDRAYLDLFARLLASP